MTKMRAGSNGRNKQRLHFHRKRASVTIARGLVLLQYPSPTGIEWRFPSRRDRGASDGRSLEETIRRRVGNQ